MKYFYMYESTDDVDANKFIEFINTNPDGELTVYINNYGGMNTGGWIMSDLINANKDRITLVAVGIIASNAFRVFFRAKCKRVIAPFTQGMMHFSSKKVTLCENGGPLYFEDQEAIRNMKAEAPITERWCKEIGMNEKEIRKMKRVEDVWFSTERLQELLAFSENN